MTSVSTSFFYAYVLPAISAAYPLAGIAFPPLNDESFVIRRILKLSSISAASLFESSSVLVKERGVKSEYCEEITALF